MISLPRYNQWGQPWSPMRLSPSVRTMATDGCFITSFAMALPNWAILRVDGTPFNPGEVLTRLVAVNGLNNEGLLTYDGVEKAFPQLYFHERIYTSNDPSNNGVEMQAAVALNKVRRLLDLGQPTILCVDNVGNDGYPDHATVASDYVLDASGNVVDFTINNPDGGQTQSFTARYGDPLKKLYGYVAIIGPPIAFPDQSTDKEDGSAVWKAAEIKKGHNVATYARELIDTLL